jgi:hypothetical protein
MPEVTSEQARGLMEENSELKLSMWYIEFKDQLFEDIVDAATKGINQIKITSDKWDYNDYKRKYLFDRLDNLGYSLKVTKGMTMQISW